jgi:hypothetical protein
VRSEVDALFRGSVSSSVKTIPHSSPWASIPLVDDAEVRDVRPDDYSRLSEILAWVRSARQPGSRHARLAARRLEPLWSRAVATGGNRWQMRRRQEMVRRGSTVRVRQRAYLKCLQIDTFVVVCSANTRTHSGHICGTRDARRRLASSSDTSVTRLVDTLTREIPRKETTSVATVGEILTPSQRERVSSRSRPTGRPLRAHFRCHRSPANPDLDDPSQPECSPHAPGPSVQRFGDQCVP